MTGVVFDIKEFALHDGQGVRTTVFLKGCPLRCIWCHNPEGLSREPELYEKKGCTDCGLCHKKCDHSDCQPFGRCLHICPSNLLRVAGEVWDCEALATKLLARESFFRQMGGGVTLSGGEPMLQADFCEALLSALHGRIHCAIETSAYAEEDTFRRIISLCDFVYMDLKLAEREAHKQYTGVYNDKILRNAEILKYSGIPHVFRIPLIPEITDTRDNLEALSHIVGDDSVELLKYNSLAPAKYQSVGRTFEFCKPYDIKKNIDVSMFKNAKIKL